MNTSNVKSRNIMKRMPVSNKNKQLVTKEQVRNMIQSMVKTDEEQKYCSFSLVPTAVDYNGSISDITAIDQGTTDSTRIGDTVRLESFDFHIWAVVGAVNALCRVITFQWANDSIPTVGDVLISTGGSAVTPMSTYNRDDSIKRRILTDDMFSLNPLYQQNYVRKYENLKLPLKEVQFSGATTDGYNKVWVLLISSTSSSNPNLGYYTKLKYTDS